MTPSYINSDAAAYLNATSGVCDIPPQNDPILTNISENATGQAGPLCLWLRSSFLLPEGPSSCKPSSSSPVAQ